MSEHGIGAPGNENENHFRAIEKHEGKAAADAARARAKGLTHSPLRPSPVPEQSHFELLLALLVDPQATRRRIAELAAAAAEARTAIDLAKTAPAELAARKAAHEDELRQMHADYKKRLAADEAAFQERCREREEALVAAEKRHAAALVADKAAAAAEMVRERAEHASRLSTAHEAAAAKIREREKEMREREARTAEAHAAALAAQAHAEKLKADLERRLEIAGPELNPQEIAVYGLHARRRADGSIQETGRGAKP